MKAQGSLSCVGVGLMLGAHLAPRARSLIEDADVVFAAMSDPLVEQWLAGLNADVRSLQDHYDAGRSRHDTYRAMADTVLAPVREGRRVCVATYGHPGVFARMPHEVIAQARREGHAAHMEPAISAADCLYADLALDPGRHGCQHYEATQFLLQRRPVDTAAWLVLWQVSLAGDRSLRRAASSRGHRQLLVDRLCEDYPADHPVIVYEAATLPVAGPRIDRCPLGRLAAQTLRLQSTLVVPPARSVATDPGLAARIAALDAIDDAGAAGTDP